MTRAADAALHAAGGGGLLQIEVGQVVGGTPVHADHGAIDPVPQIRHFAVHMTPVENQHASARPASITSDTRLAPRKLD